MSPCTLNEPRPHPVSCSFKEVDDILQVYDGLDGLRLHPGPGFTGVETPALMLSASSGEMVVRLRSDATDNGAGFRAIFSADCPQLIPGEGAIGTAVDTVFGSSARFMCPEVR